MTIMLKNFTKWTSKVVKSRRKPSDPDSNPANFNGTLYETGGNLIHNNCKFYKLTT